MTLQTIEVEIDQTGHVRPLKPNENVPAGPALLTPLGSHRTAPLAPRAPEAEEWHALIGMLQGSPSWHDEPQTIQQALRDEWR